MGASVGTSVGASVGTSTGTCTTIGTSNDPYQASIDLIPPLVPDYVQLVPDYTSED